MRNKLNQLFFWVLLIILLQAPGEIFGQSSCDEKIPAIANNNAAQIEYWEICS